MGDISCRCNPQSNNPHLPEVQISQNPLSRPSNMEPNQKKVRSRINSIVSPRLLIQHSKSNSGALMSDKAINSTQQCRLSIDFDGSNIEQIIIGKIPKNIVSLHHHSNINSQSEQYDIMFQSNLEDDVYGFNAKFAGIKSGLTIKDKGIGLGVFKWISQGSQIQINTNCQGNDSPVILDIGVGNFVLIISQVEEKFRKKYKTVKCFIITKNSGGNVKLSRSLPLIYDEANFVEQQKCVNIKQGQSKTVGGKLIVKLLDKKTLIKSIHYEGFYKLMSEFEEVGNGNILRLGIKLFTVSLEQQGQTIYKIRPKF